jgi:YjbE family integral membrane protein
VGSIPQFLIGAFSIVLIDLLLAGDNALVIAMTVRPLPRRQRLVGIACGASLAVILRVALTIVAAQLLTLEFIKLAGGVLIVWIAWKVLADASSEDAAAARPHSLLQAIWYITLADLTMSTDNILAIAAASKGSSALIIFGLCLSIPFVVSASNLLAILMDRYPLTIYLGAAILGRVAGDMIVTDPFISRTLHPPAVAAYILEAVLVGGLLGSRLLLARRAKK